MANAWEDFEIDPIAETKFLDFARRYQETSTLRSDTKLGSGHKLTHRPGLKEIMAGARAKKTEEKLFGNDGNLKNKVLSAIKQRGEGAQDLDQKDKGKSAQPFPWLPKKPPIKPSREYKRLKKRLDKVHARVISKYKESQPWKMI